MFAARFDVVIDAHIIITANVIMLCECVKRSEFISYGE